MMRRRGISVLEIAAMCAAVFALGACSEDECPIGLVVCADSCRDLRNDVVNCGACGKACVSGEVCAAGQCQASCLAGQLMCGDKCVDPQTDRTYCGAAEDCAGANAGTVCLSGQVCAAGQCQASCLAGQLLCGDKCVDPQTDRTFCGAIDDCAGANAGTVCPSGEVCAAGKCQASCLAGQLLCGDKCVDPQTDRAYCGAAEDCAEANAGTVCPSGEVCAAGQCQASCLAGQLLCGDKCVDPQTDRAFCGAAGNCAGAHAGTVCQSGSVCAGGNCVTSCLPRLVACGGTCIDPLTDLRFCGASDNCTGAKAGVVCGIAEHCVFGSCSKVWSFEYTGGIQAFVVPDGVTALRVEANGAAGGGVTWAVFGGGAGAQVTATVPVTPKETLWVYVGGEGEDDGWPGFNGGGRGSISGGGGGGGGASDVRRGGVDLANRILVAAGGGGGVTLNAYGIRGGAGGCTEGSPGANGALANPNATGGGGGTQTAGGAAGLGGNNNAGLDGRPGQFGFGGAGSVGASMWTGGAGGGGYYGGGGGGGLDATGSSGASAAGGGGSSYWRLDFIDTTCSAGVRYDNGRVVITIL